ncbi:ubiquitin domain-containing protein UBFD1 isoform X1 [Lissotriton helveticus]
MEADAEKDKHCCGEIGDCNTPLTEVAQAQPDGESSQASVSNGGDTEGDKELVEFKIIWNKNKYDVKLPMDSTGASLKQKIHSLTGLPPAMQKVMFKGLVSEEKTLRELKVTNGAKVMVVGSTINDVLAVNTPKETIQEEVKAEESKKEPICRQKQHRKVLDKGKPDDVMPAIKGAPERLPTVPLAGMYNKSGGKVRLTFKLEQDQLWIGTKERTEKIPMGSIKNVITEVIEGHEDYYMMHVCSTFLPLMRLHSSFWMVVRSSWVRRKPPIIGYIGYQRSMWTLSRTPSWASGSIFEVMFTSGAGDGP